MDDFDELRRLLVGREQEQLRELTERIDDKARRAKELASVLPQAVRLSRERGEDLARALQPAVQSSVRESVEKQPELFVDLLHPIIGSIVRRSIAESLRGLLQSLNRTLEHTVSLQGLKWRFEAMRTGRSFAEVVLLRSLVYRVEQVFLIHKETSLLLLHASADEAKAQNSDMVAAMLSAIQDFVRDGFQAAADAQLDEFRVGGLQVWVVPGRYAFLAAAIYGDPPRSLHGTLEETIESVHIQKGAELAKFAGDSSAFESLRPEIEACLTSQLQDRADTTQRPVFAWLLIGAAIFAVVLVGWFVQHRSQQWGDFLARLKVEPGIVITEARQGWLAGSLVSGMRDPLAADPALLARPAGLDPVRIEFAWKEYMALDGVSVARRFASRFGVPKGARMVVVDGTAEIAGSVPYEWIELVRRDGLQVAGIASLVERDVKLTYDPARALERFETAYPPPADVEATMDGGTLTLRGVAPYEWIATVREGALHLPGIAALSETGLRTSFDPALVLRRFEARFRVPDTVTLGMRGTTLVLSGEAPHAWLARVREGGTAVPGITALDEANLIDVDLRNFQQTKSVIESAFIYFLVNKDNFATEGFAALSRLPEEIRKCETAAKRLGIALTVQVLGYADGVGQEAKNLDLSQRRAEAVRKFLVTCGLDAALFSAVAGGPPPPSADGKPTSEQSDRRVAFRIVSPP